MAQHRPRKPASVEYTTDEEDTIVYDMGGDIESPKNGNTPGLAFAPLTPKFTHSLTMRKKFGPAQCYRCQGFFHSSRFCTRNPKCGKPHLTRDCTKKRDEDPTCCHCQGSHPANFTGCPRNPLNRPPPPPKVNFWEERARKKKEMLDAAKEKSEQAKRAQNEAPVQARPSGGSPSLGEYGFHAPEVP
ncbi:uncharacterized protein TNCV_3922561 [Trichonephila clavipes]|nr:uncharacterized protein TNCV_3922561 [Trichonephila clavipes]